jgi:hypothetical protein
MERRWARAQVVAWTIMLIWVGLAGCGRAAISVPSSRTDAGSADVVATGTVLLDSGWAVDTAPPKDDRDSQTLTTRDAALNCVHAGPCSVRCSSGSQASDVMVSVDQTTSGFLVRVVQTVPAPCDQTFSDVQTLSSGDFLNYSGQNGQWQFHLLPTNSGPSGVSGDDNVEVYPVGGSMDSGPVDVTRDLLCWIYPK